VSKGYFTTSMTSNFLMLFIPPLPGCVAYMIAKEIITDMIAKEIITGVSLLLLLLPVLIGVGVLVVLFPINC